MTKSMTSVVKVAAMLLLFTFSGRLNAQFTVTPGITAAQIAAAIAGEGLTVSNVTVNCSAQSYGSFSNGAAAGLGMGNGLVMTTGNAQTLGGGPNGNDNWSFNSPTDFFPNDPQLTATMNTNQVIDGCFVEFDVVPMCGNIAITFVFGSDEYNNWVNANFNDGFGFFVSGPNPAGGNYTSYNVARLPNNTVVSIDNVNLNTNNGFFINNTPGVNAPNNFDGFTTVLSPGFDVTPCATYHFKLAIADATDNAMDSGVLVNIITCSDPLTGQVETQPATCTDGGSAVATATGGLGPFTYTWAPIAGNGAEAANLPPGEYTVTIDDAIPCQQPVTLNVTIDGPDSPVMDPVPAQTACNAAAIDVPAFTSSPAGAAYSWTNSNPSIGLAANGTGNIPSFTATNLTTTPVTATITVTPAIGECTGDPVTFTITVDPTVTPQFDPAPEYCQGTAMAALPASSSNGITGSWAPALNNNATTTYTFTPAAGQCAANSQMTIAIVPQTTPAFDPAGAFCAGSAVPALPVTSLNGISGTWTPAINNAATTQYTFTPAAGECAMQQQLTVAIIQPETPQFDAYDTYCQGTEIPALPQTSLNGIDGSWSPALDNNATTEYTFTPAADECAAEAQLTIDIAIPTVPQFAPLADICQNAAVSGLPAVSQNNLGGSWSPSALSSAAPGTFTATFTPDEGLCATIAEVSLTVNPLPQITVNSPAVCPNVDAILTAGGAESYTWTPSAGLSDNEGAEVIASVTSQSTFTVTGTDANGCQSSAEATVFMSPPLMLNVSPSAPVICEGGEITLTATGADNYSWTPDGSLSAAAGSEITANPTVTTTYTIEGEENGCIASTTVTVTVSDPVSPDFAATGPFCAGTAVAALPSVSPNGITGAWSPAINNEETTEYTFTPDAGQCALPAVMTITIDQPVQTQFPPVPPFCEGAGFEGMPSTDMNGIPGTWSPAVVSNYVSDDYTFIPDQDQCALGSVVEIEIMPNPIADFDMSDTELRLPNRSIDFTNSSSNANGFSWSFGDGHTSELEDPTHTFADAAGNYTITLTATNELGCIDQTTRTLVVKEDLIVYVPNAFTPDGDAYNNEFTPKITGDFDRFDYTLYIFDRWGTTIFESHNVEIGWDGTYMNKLVQDGVYTWKVELKLRSKDERKTFAGSVTKLR
jgi:gliding motility-associated-like protein